MSDGAADDRLIGDRFRLLTPLGRGHSGQVWQAVDEQTGQPVALKLYRARRGEDPAVRVSHPCVVGIFFHGTHEGAAFTVMELVDGISLATALRDGPIQDGTAKAIALGICDALQAAHASGVVHGKLKPSNVLIAEGRAGHPVVKVGDFIGRGDPREDMYALGLLMEAMSGRRDSIVERLLSREPYTPTQVRAILTGNPSAVTEPEDETEPDRPRLVRPAVLSGVATLVVVIAACAWFLKPPVLPDLDSAAPSSRFSLSPAGTTDTAQGRPAAPAATSKPPPAAPAAQPSASAGKAIDATKAVIAVQLGAGNIEPDAASMLNDKLDDIARFQARGQTKQAGQRIDSLKSQLAAMLRAKRVTEEGYTVILASIGKLA